MRQGITTQYRGPTNFRGSRIKALARKRDSIGGEMSLTVPYSHGDANEEHCKAAKALAVKLGWSGFWVAGGAPDGRGNMYVNLGNAVPAQRVHGEGYRPNAPQFEGQDYFIVEAVK